MVIFYFSLYILIRHSMSLPFYACVNERVFWESKLFFPLQREERLIKAEKFPGLKISIHVGIPGLENLRNKLSLLFHSKLSLFQNNMKHGVNFQNPKEILFKYNIIIFL